MDETTIVQTGEIRAFGRNFPVELFSRGSGGWYAMTRFDEHDAIITDGRSPAEAMARHADWLPIAVSCRSRRLTGPARSADTP